MPVIKAEYRKIGSLESIIIPGKPGGACVVLFHGYGADAQDLAHMGPLVPGPEGVTWIFPNAPNRIPIGPSLFGRAWFNVDVVGLEEATRRKAYSEITERRPVGIDESRDYAIELFETLGPSHSKVVLGGFSQGAMLATEVALTHSSKPDGLVILSGTLIDKMNWQKKAPSCAGLPFFQSHGDKDPLLSVDVARELEQLLKQAGLVGDLHVFSGGHEVSMSIVEKLGAFLTEVL